MLIDLLSTSNYISFNIEVARILGLKQAVYISEMMNINSKAIRKNKIDDKFFKLDREYLTKRTTLTIDEQLDIEKALIEVGVIQRDSKDKELLCVDIETLASIVSGSNIELDKDIGSIMKRKASKRPKAECIGDNLMLSIKTTNVELKSLYREWIDSVIARQGYMTKAVVIDGEQKVDKYSNHNLDIALEIVKIASLNSLNNMNYAIERFEKSGKKFNFKPKRTLEEVGLGGGV